MVNNSLLEELSETYSDMTKQHDRNVEITFMLQNYSLFAANKKIIYSALKGQSGQINGNELCSLLGIGDTVNVEKVKETDLFNFCYSAADSKLFKRCIEIFKEKRSATIFFVVGKSKSIVVSNQYRLDPAKGFSHRFASTGNLNDITWAPVSEIVDRLQLWS